MVLRKKKGESNGYVKMREPFIRKKAMSLWFFLTLCKFNEISCKQRFILEYMAAQKGRKKWCKSEKDDYELTLTSLHLCC